MARDAARTLLCKSLAAQPLRFCQILPRLPAAPLAGQPRSPINPTQGDPRPAARVHPPGLNPLHLPPLPRCHAASAVPPAPCHCLRPGSLTLSSGKCFQFFCNRRW